MARRSRVRGARQVSRNLRELARSVTAPIAVASRFALRPTVKAARANIAALGLTDSTGALLASMAVKRAWRGKVKQRWRVGPRADFSRGNRRPVKYAHLLEFGTRRSRAFPFMTPAYFETRQEIVDRFGPRFWREFEKKIKKLSRGKRS